MSIDPIKNFNDSLMETGYVPFSEATDQTYAELGFKSGLEIHQQLLTDKKLFCRCPAGIFQKPDDYDAEIIRHMRPTLSEMGGYDGTALMERKTRKNIFYRIKNETACTYEIDDTPPFAMNQKALEAAIEISLLLGGNVVGELHITRKQYLDGSIPTGFQRTGIVSVAGQFPISTGTIRILQLSIEEDSCREVSDIGHNRVYRTDRLGMPLIETVTLPDMKTPAQVAEAAQYLRFLARSTGHVRTGVGAARQDVNVSIEGSQRVEIKGVPSIRWIPLLTHIEAFRHKSLLVIKDKLHERISVNDREKWKIEWCEITIEGLSRDTAAKIPINAEKIIAVNLPRFSSILSHFTQPGRDFGSEISDRLKVIACLEKPNLIHSETSDVDSLFDSAKGSEIEKELGVGARDAQIIFWGPAEDVKTALETIEERCQLAFEGVPNETRRAISGGRTLFERVLPGPDRMYPDTDSAPIPISEDRVDTIEKNLPMAVSRRMEQLKKWQVPDDCFEYLLRYNLVGDIELVVTECNIPAKFIGTLFGHWLKHIEGRYTSSAPFNRKKVFDLLRYLSTQKLHYELAKKILPEMYQHPNMDFESLVAVVDYEKSSLDELLDFIPVLHEKFRQINRSDNRHAYLSWVMGNLRSRAVGNLPLSELKSSVEKVVANG